jgi:multisubunit Na+/H+ antiporter MnhB subunit
MNPLNHYLLVAAAKWLVPFFQIMGLFMLFRGHNDPGGGFIGGLIVGASFVIKFMKTKEFQKIKESHRMEDSQNLGEFQNLSETFSLWGFSCEQWMGVGLFLALLSGFVSVFYGNPYMTGVWQGEVWLPLVGLSKLGTPFYFDTGVFCVVTGVIVKVFLFLED